MIRVNAAGRLPGDGSHMFCRLTIIVAAVATLLLPSAASAQAAAGGQDVLTGAADAAAIQAVLARAANEGLALPAGSEADLPAAAIAYAKAQHGGRIRADRFMRDWAILPAPYDAAGEFSAAVRERRLASWLEQAAPAEPRYSALARAYARYRGLAAAGGWNVLEIGPALRPGATGARVESLRRRLVFEDPAVAGQGDSYDPALAAAVERAQARYGLTVDGVAGPKTQAALNVPAVRRLEQIEANLERWRWMPRDLPARRTEVNTAAALLTMWENGKPILTMRIIPGKPATPTPMFTDRVTGVVFNPPWTVPAKIAAEEIWPRIAANPRYLSDQGFMVLPNGTLRQLPGPKAALGLFKFEMGNPFGVYLHDTPNRSFFAWDQRLLSHGCMRVEQPRAMAGWLLRGDLVWTGDTIDAALATGVTIRAPLRDSVPVFVIHETALIDAEGVLQLRDDAYGWDQALVGLIRRSPSS